MDNFEKLAELFSHFPGIGERQSKRFVYFLMAKNPNYAQDLAKTILELKKETAQCSECFRFFNKKNESKMCENCANTSDFSALMILEKDADFESVKKSKVYIGRYFILGGLVPIVEKSTPSRIRMEELKEKIKQNAKNGLKEIILAFSLSPQGEHTDMYLREQLKDLADKLEIKISSLGRGLSTGTELEYSDNDTLKNALKNRQ